MKMSPLSKHRSLPPDTMRTAHYNFSSSVNFSPGELCLQTRTCLEIRNPCLYVRKSVLKFWHWLIIS